MPAGRPSEYRPEFCKRVVEIMGEGLSLTAAMGELGFHRETALEWGKIYPEFSDAVTRGQAQRTAFLERGMLNSEIGARVTARIFALKNAAPDEWKDRHEVTGRDGNPIEMLLKTIQGSNSALPMVAAPPADDEDGA